MQVLLDFFCMKLVTLQVILSPFPKHLRKYIMGKIIWFLQTLFNRCHMSFNRKIYLNSEIIKKSEILKTKENISIPLKMNRFFKKL